MSRQPIRWRCAAVAGHEIGVGQANVTAHHVERCVTEDVLEAEHVAAIDQGPGEGVAERVRAAAGADASLPAEAGERILNAPPAELLAVAADEQRVSGPTRPRAAT